MEEKEIWRKCSHCKKPIGLNSKYFECSVSTCTGLRTGYVFCSLPCWEAHVPGARHRSAGAIEKKSPTFAQMQIQLQSQQQHQQQEIQGQQLQQQGQNHSPQRILVRDQSKESLVNRVFLKPPAAAAASKDVLVVVSKLKDYIRLRSEMNTSDGVKDILSDHLRNLCDQAIDRARAAGRKTVLDRDFEDSTD